MNVETGAFAVVTDQLMALAARVEALEPRDAAREITFRIICGAANHRPQPMELVYNAGGVSVRRGLGVAGMFTNATVIYEDGAW